MAQVEPMDIDNVGNDFDDKENSLVHSNVLPRTPCTEKGYEELDVSELNMKLRYSITPASSPMSRSFTASCKDNKTYSVNEDSLNSTIVNNNANLTRSLNSSITKCDITKSPKLPLQALPAEQYLDINSTMRRSIDNDPNNITITINGTDNIDENLSLPSTSSSTAQTPEATTPTKDIPKDGGSPIMRGLKSVLNMFRSSQSPIPPEDIDKKDPGKIQEEDVQNEPQIVLASTPKADIKNRDHSSKRSSPLKDSVTFNDDLERELQWKDEMTIIFKQEKIPIHKLYLQQSTSLALEKKLASNKENETENLNSTVEYMDISYNESGIADKTMVDIDSKLNNEASNAVESDGEFVDCETTYSKSEQIDSANINTTVNLENNELNQVIFTEVHASEINEEKANIELKIEPSPANISSIESNIQLEEKNVLNAINDVQSTNKLDNDSIVTEVPTESKIQLESFVKEEIHENKNINITTELDESLNKTETNISKDEQNVQQNTTKTEDELKQNNISNTLNNDAIIESNDEKHSTFDATMPLNVETDNQDDILVNRNNVSDNFASNEENIHANENNTQLPNSGILQICENVPGIVHEHSNETFDIGSNTFNLDKNVTESSMVNEDIIYSEESKITLDISKNDVTYNFTDEDIKRIESEFKLSSLNTTHDVTIPSSYVDVKDNAINNLNSSNTEIVKTEEMIEKSYIKNNLETDNVEGIENNVQLHELASNEFETHLPSDIPLPSDDDIEKDSLIDNYVIKNDDVDDDLDIKTLDDINDDIIDSLEMMDVVNQEDDVTTNLEYPGELTNVLPISTIPLPNFDHVQNDIVSNTINIPSSLSNYESLNKNEIPNDLLPISQCDLINETIILTENTSTIDCDLLNATNIINEPSLIINCDVINENGISHEPMINSETINQTELVDKPSSTVSFELTGEAIILNENMTVSRRETINKIEVTNEALPMSNSESTKAELVKETLSSIKCESPDLYCETINNVEIPKEPSSTALNESINKVELLNESLPKSDCDTSSKPETSNDVLMTQDLETINKPEILNESSTTSEFESVNKIETSKEFSTTSNIEIINDVEMLKESLPPVGSDSMNNIEIVTAATSHLQETTTVLPDVITESNQNKNSKAVENLHDDISTSSGLVDDQVIDINNQSLAEIKTVEDNCNIMNEEHIKDIASVELNENKLSDEEIVTSANNSPYVSINDVGLNIPKSDKNLDDIESPFETKSKMAISPPISPKLSRKGYNINFDEIDDPFATKINIRMSPPPETSPNTSSAVKNVSEKKPDEKQKRAQQQNRRKSQPARQKRDLTKKRFNSSYSCDTRNNISQQQTDQTLNKNDTTKTVVDENITPDLNSTVVTSQIEVDNEKPIDIKMDDLENIDISNKNIINPEDAITQEESKPLNCEPVIDNPSSLNFNTQATPVKIFPPRNVFNLPEIDDMNFNPFATKSKMRNSPSPTFEKENTQSTEAISISECSNETQPQPTASVTLNIEINTQEEKAVSSDLSSETCSSKNTDMEFTVREVATEDEDTAEGPFIEADDFADIVKVSDFGAETDMMQFEDLQTTTNNENKDEGELFIDAEAFEFLLNQNKSNVVADSGKESLFLKFDPLFAKRVSSEGVLAALSRIQRRQSTPKKIPEASKRSAVIAEETTSVSSASVPSVSTTNVDTVFEDSHDEANITITKPMMVVNPAVSSLVSPRKSTTPPRVNRRSLTFTSPAMAVIDRLLSLSGNNSTLEHDTSLPRPNREYNETDVALTQLRELLAEKEIHVHNLRSETKELKERLATMESQVKALEKESEERLKKVNDLNDRLTEKAKINKSMAVVVEEYERTIASLIAEMEQEKRRNAEERAKLISERDEQTAHLSSMEVSFSDLHSKYEKSKQIILSMKANEDTCRKSMKEFEVNLLKMQNNYELLKQHATSKLNFANQELEKFNRAHESEVLKLNAMMKRKELHITSLEESLAQKTKANEELTAICDELINKVG